MFDIEQSIADWRRRMIAAGIKTPVPLKELELHLRDEIERQMKSGKSEVEAFETAVQEIGHADVVRNEFEKIEDEVDERKWKEGQIGLGIILGLLQLISIGAVLFNSEMTLGQRLSSLTAIALSIMLAGAGWLSHRVLPAIRDRLTRIAAIIIAGGVPMIIWVWILARFYLIGHEFPFGEWLTKQLWICCPPLGLYLGFILGLETAARKKVAS
jgi:hypothetical protein